MLRWYTYRINLLDWPLFAAKEGDCPIEEYVCTDVTNQNIDRIDFGIWGGPPSRTSRTGTASFIDVLPATMSGENCIRGWF